MPASPGISPSTPPVFFTPVVPAPESKETVKTPVKSEKDTETLHQLVLTLTSQRQITIILLIILAVSITGNIFMFILARRHHSERLAALEAVKHIDVIKSATAKVLEKVARTQTELEKELSETGEKES
ncbi:MAG: hypothetical protein M1536_09305 [Firmicutes bacterium]|nr:hypothetical protein [Bacillota bacterium]